MSEKIQEGQQVITACAFIHHNFDDTTKVFSAKRAETKKFLPGRWELPGGHIDFGEDIVEGLKREIKEEFGMDIQEWHFATPARTSCSAASYTTYDCVDVIYMSEHSESTFAPAAKLLIAEGKQLEYPSAGT